MERWNGNDEIDCVLTREEDILPSSGFAVSVMDAVRREAVAPPPIPFPWVRALPGMAAGVFALALVLVSGVAAIARSVHAPATVRFSVPSPSLLPSLFQPNLEGAAIWTVLALLAALVSVKLSMRLGAGSS
ncbi:MAG: hypothetical protein WAK29_20235 [Terriglobales bacterium]